MWWLHLIHVDYDFYGASPVLGSTPASGRSPGKGLGNPLQYSHLESPMDRGACQMIVRMVAKSHMTKAT